MKIILIVAALFIGITIGMYVGTQDFKSQIVTTYEDGGFVGCYRGAICNE